MPGSERSLRVTDAYRRRLLAAYERAGVIAATNFTAVDPQDLDGSWGPFAERTVEATIVLQRAAVALTAGYLAAFLASETGDAASLPPAVDLSAVGVAQHGAPLEDAIQSPLIGAKTAIRDGATVDQALGKARARVVRLSQSATVAAPRAALHEAIRSDDRIIGWRRVTAGGCGACLAATTGAIHEDREVLQVHSHCRCTAEPVVRGVPDTARRPTGFEIFNGLPSAQQDQLLGPDKAQLIRTGAVPFERLIAVDRMVEGPDQLVEAPLKALV